MLFGYLLFVCRFVVIECLVYRETEKSRCEIKYNHPKLLSNIQYRVPFFNMRFHLQSIEYILAHAAVQDDINNLYLMKRFTLYNIS